MDNLEKAYEEIESLTKQKDSGRASPDLDGQIEEAWSRFWLLYRDESSAAGLDAGLPSDITKKILEMVERSILFGDELTTL